MAIQTTGYQQPIEIREMSKDLEIYFNGLSRGIRNPDTLLQYLTIGYYYNKLPRYTMLDYLRSCLGSSWLKFAIDTAKRIENGESLLVFDGPRDVYIPYSALAEEILMILDIINAYEKKVGVTIDEVTTVSQFDSYYSDFTKFISQYTTNAYSGLRTRKPVDSQTVISRFIQLELINDSYQQQKLPQKREISMEEDISSEEFIEEPQVLDVNEDGESKKGSTIETLAGKLRKVSKKGKKSNYTKTVSKKDVNKEKEEGKGKSLRKQREIEKKKKEADEPLPMPMPVPEVVPVSVPVTTSVSVSTPTSISEIVEKLPRQYRDLYNVVTEIRPEIEKQKVEFPSIQWLSITDEDIRAILDKDTEKLKKRILTGKIPEDRLREFSIPKYKIGWLYYKDISLLMLDTNIKSQKGEDVTYLIAVGPSMKPPEK